MMDASLKFESSPIARFHGKVHLLSIQPKEQEMVGISAERDLKLINPSEWKNEWFWNDWNRSNIRYFGNVRNLSTNQRPRNSRDSEDHDKHLTRPGEPTCKKFHTGWHGAPFTNMD